MKIADFDIGLGVVFAPMAGYSDIGFRHLCRKYGADLTYTEMISAKGLMYNNPKTKELLALSPLERPSAVQLFGSDPDAFIKVADKGLLDSFDIIDINMGCPVRKIVMNGEGSQLMNNIPLAQQVVKACLNFRKPVTVKFRSGFNTVTAPDFAKALEDAGAAALTIHARTREQFYSGEADWNVIKKVKNSVTIPIIGNGDIRNYSDIIRMKEFTGCDGVMIGRAALGNPYIFSPDTVRNIKADIEEHINLLLTIYNPSITANLMKKHICFYGKNLKNSKSLKGEINSVMDIEGIWNIVDKYF